MHCLDSWANENGDIVFIELALGDPCLTQNGPEKSTPQFKNGFASCTPAVESC
jgi:hypothetical protein